MSTIRIADVGIQLSIMQLLLISAVPFFDISNIVNKY